GRGFAVGLRKFTVHFGRATDNVHVPVGTGDDWVSRLHGIFVCDGGQWWLRNQGRRPIHLPGADMVLCGHELPMTAGYTPLTIDTPSRRSHLLEVYVTGPFSDGAEGDADASTRESDAYDLSLVERLVVTALAQRYLRQERYPQPVAWQQVADDLGRAIPQRAWTPKGAEHIVAGIRKRLSGGRRPVPGLLREDGIGEPVGNTLNHNLIQALLNNATLLPEDLYLLGEDA